MTGKLSPIMWRRASACQPGCLTIANDWEKQALNGLFTAIS